MYCLFRKQIPNGLVFSTAYRDYDEDSTDDDDDEGKQRPSNQLKSDSQYFHCWTFWYRYYHDARFWGMKYEICSDLIAYRMRLILQLDEHL